MRGRESQIGILIFPSALSQTIAMTNKIRIALAQTNPISVEVDLAESEKDKHVSPFPTLEHNLVDAARAVKDAAERGADVVVFPEYFLQGFVNEGRQVSPAHSDN